MRRVIELASPHLLRALGADGITLITGERPPTAWLRAFRAMVTPAPVRVCVDAVLGYTDQPLRDAVVRAALERTLPEHGLVWAHNLALGRNLTLSRVLAAVCAARDLPLVAHHHDWWCDRRWPRWPVIQRCGFRTLAEVAAAIFPARGRVAHVAINEADARILRRHFPRRAHWLPNLAERSTPTKRSTTRDAPIWLMPCRVLRRKNIAEALLLTRWLRPEATLVVTGGADEADEIAYASALRAAAREHGWPLRLGALNTRGNRRRSVADLTASAEAIVFTSIQEGFGLPQVEAAAAGCPAIVRRVPQVAPDLAAFGFRFPQTYDEIVVSPALFDWTAERQRQTATFRAWLAQLPRGIRPLAEKPALLTGSHIPRPVPFSRLTLIAQLEVLRHAPAESWSHCAPLNPFLASWRGQAARGRLAATPWPRGADTFLSGASYARHLAEIADIQPTRPLARAKAIAAQLEFIRTRLEAADAFPLLWSVRQAVPLRSVTSD